MMCPGGLGSIRLLDTDSLFPDVAARSSSSSRMLGGLGRFRPRNLRPRNLDFVLENYVAFVLDWPIYFRNFGRAQGIPKKIKQAMTHPHRTIVNPLRYEQNPVRIRSQALKESIKQELLEERYELPCMRR